MRGFMPVAERPRQGKVGLGLRPREFCSFFAINPAEGSRLFPIESDAENQVRLPKRAVLNVWA